MHASVESVADLSIDVGVDVLPELKHVQVEDALRGVSGAGQLSSKNPRKQTRACLHTHAVAIGP
jgi:hypothetical protein